MFTQKYISFLFFISVLCSCTNSPKTLTDIEKIDFMKGKWVYEEDGKTYSETWNSIEDETMSAVNNILSNSDTVFSSNLTILYKDKTLNYIRFDTTQQMNVSYKMVKLIPNNILFKNENQSFPKTINYIFNESGYLYRKEEGSINGERVKREYFYKKYGIIN